MPATFTIDTVCRPIYDNISNVFVGPAMLLVASAVIAPFAGWAVISIFTTFALLVLILHLTRSSQPAPVVNWWNEIVLITGGCHGVGLGVVELLSKKYKPKKIVVLDINNYDFKDESVVLYQCDVSNFAKVKEVAGRINKEVGAPTMVINNAGIVNGKLFVDLSEQEIQRVMNVNLFGPMWITKAFMPKMIEMNRGHIVNVASVMGITGARSMVDYCAAKFGVVGFNEALRQEVHNTNIKVSAIYPGLINTGMFDGVVFKFPWMTPPLETIEVVNGIVDILVKNRSTEIKLPFFVELTPLLRMLPVEYIDFVKEFTGANDSMHTFSGKEKK
ncbi:hypothetical protein HDU97_003468 [Phlyctochytrium planicorne]|nr:hypothetical protein HDU97_003468 [Phlyctochytrium planicorne]